jgi:hypothetical protein
MKNLALAILLISLAGLVSCKASKRSTPNYGHQKILKNRV